MTDELRNVTDAARKHLSILRRGLSGRNVGDAPSTFDDMAWRMLDRHDLITRRHGGFFLTEKGLALTAQLLAEAEPPPYLVDGYSVDDVAVGSPAFLRIETRRCSRPATVVEVVKFPNGYVHSVVVRMDDGLHNPEAGGSAPEERHSFALRSSGQLASLGSVVRIGRRETEAPGGDGVTLAMRCAFLLDGVPLAGVVAAAVPTRGRLTLHRRIDDFTSDPGVRAWHGGDERILSWSSSMREGLPPEVDEEWTISSAFPHTTMGERVIVLPIQRTSDVAAYLLGQTPGTWEPTLVTSGGLEVDGQIRNFARSRGIL